MWFEKVDPENQSQTMTICTAPVTHYGGAHGENASEKENRWKTPKHVPKYGIMRKELHLLGFRSESRSNVREFEPFLPEFMNIRANAARTSYAEPKLRSLTLFERFLAEKKQSSRLDS